MPDSKSIRRKGKPCLAIEENLKDTSDAMEAFTNMEVSPAGAGHLVVNGKAAKLDLTPSLGNEVLEVYVDIGGLPHKVKLMLKDAPVPAPVV